MWYREYNPTFRLYLLSSSLSSLSSLSSFSLSSPVFCNQATKYKKNDFETENGSGYEMTDLSLTESNVNAGSNTDVSVTNVSVNTGSNVITNVNISFGVYYWRKSEFLAAMWNTIQFIILIGGFEYLFFITIVNKYKIVSAKLLLCKLIQG